jgi:antitoxin FitA
MSKMIQIRNVPEPLHRKLKVKAAEEGMTLSDYLLRMAEREVDTISFAVLAKEIRAREQPGDFSGGDVIRELRDSLS